MLNQTCSDLNSDYPDRLLGVLRTATAPMSAEEIGIALLRSKGVAEPVRAEIELMYGSVSASLKYNREVTVHEGRPRRWTLTKT
jgi:hypothetical protein